jgi:hypothetical protein
LTGKCAPLILVWAATALIGVLGFAASANGASAATRRPTVFVGPNGSAFGPCTRARPCRSLNRAYHVANPGEVVQVAGGSYGRQDLTGDPSKTSARDVVFRAAPGARVRISDITFGRYSGSIGASHVTMRRMTFADGVVFNRVSDVTLRRINIVGGFWINGSRRIRIIRGRVGPCTGCHPDIQWEYNSNPKRIPRNILIDGVYFHDMRIGSPGDHVECLQVSDVDGLVIRNSRFRRCGIFGLHIQGTEASPPRNILVENNFFAAALDGGFYSLSIMEGTNVKVRNNSSPQGFRFGSAGTISNWLVAGNLAPYATAACDDRITFRSNVWRGGSCGATDRNVSRLGFRDVGSFNLHLRRNSPAINRGYPGSYPLRDIDHQRRPLGVRPDAGADEVR